MQLTASNDNIRGASVRFVVEPRLIPPAKAARRLHLSSAEFDAKRAALHRHGFPLPCPIIGHFDLVAIDAWLDKMSGVGAETSPISDPASLVEARLAAIG